MQEKQYLKWYNKVGYGSGDIAGNVVYALLSSFVMIYLTNTVGLNPGIVGTLIAASKFFDGVTDIFFGAMIDKTKSRMGKARPWMLYAYIGCAVTLVAIFAVPLDMGRTSQYIWFFIAYTLLNAVFYTANNIAYSALTALVTKNSKERVQMGSYRFIFAFATSLLIQSITIGAVAAFGGGAFGWRTIAIIYAIIGLLVNTISVLSVKELSQEELSRSDMEEENGPEAGNNLKAGDIQAKGAVEEKYGLMEAAKLLIANKYYLMICGVYILQQIYTAMINMGIYYMTYVLKNENLYGVFSWAVNIPLIIALLLTPALVVKWNGMYKLNLRGYMISTAGRALVIVAGYLGSVPLMLLFTGIAALGQGPWQGDMKKHKRVDGTMYSCTSLGIKLGGGLGTAVAGWLLAASGFVGTAAVQSDSCIRMLYFIYLWIPMLISLAMTFILSRMNVEAANKKIKQQGDV